MKVKKSMLKVLTLAGMTCMLGLSLGTTSCGGETVVEDPEDKAYGRFNLVTEDGQNSYAVGDKVQVSIDPNSLTSGLTLEDLANVSYSSQDPEVMTVSDTGEVTMLQPGETSIIAVAPVTGTNGETTVVDSIELSVAGKAASGLYNYSGAGYETQQEILGVLEKYAQDTYLSGIPLCGDGQYLMYSDRVQKGTETYVEGYGFGILGEGSLTGPLSGETNPDYQMYYHSYISEDPLSFNAWDSNVSTVTDLCSYTDSAYFGTRLNEDGTDWEYMSVLATGDDFIALDPTSDASPQATQFKLYVKTGANTGGKLKYTTNSTDPRFAKYNNREVELEDYLTPFKCLLTQSNALFRGQEMVGTDYARPIKGAADYYNQTADGYNEELFQNVGVKVGTDAGGDYIQFEFEKPLTVSDAKSNLSSSMYAPIPYEFIEEIGGAQMYGSFNEDASLTPVDTMLSLGQFALEYYEQEKLIVFKKNPNDLVHLEHPELNNIDGVHMQVLTAAKNDTEAAFREFLAGRLDSCSIPGSLLSEYINDPRTTQIPETTTWKVNLNATTQELWEELFGENGTITQTPANEYWEVKPIMSNTHFLDGLYYSINRNEFADSQNFTASQDYLSQAYYFTDDEGGQHYYYESDAHAKAIEHRYPETKGYNLEAARTFFKLAIQEEVDAGHYSYGTAENPTYIDVSAKWMSTNSMRTMGEPITKYMTDAFNSVDPRIQLRITNTVAGSDSDAMYDALNYGQFDIGMGAITGMQAWPLDFFQVLCSDNRSGFTLNWGPDTGVNDGKIYYDGATWSFDGLWSAGTSAKFIANGEEAQDPILVNKVVDGSYEVVDATAKDLRWTLTLDAVLCEGVTLNLKGLHLEDYATSSGPGSGQLYSLDVTETAVWDQEALTVEFDVPGEVNVVYPPELGADEYNYVTDVYLVFEVQDPRVAEPYEYEVYLGGFYLAYDYVTRA